jgi:hypothetical protein
MYLAFPDLLGGGQQRIESLALCPSPATPKGEV